MILAMKNGYFGINRFLSMKRVHPRCYLPLTMLEMVDLILKRILILG
jgi:hypothetical protein